MTDDTKIQRYDAMHAVADGDDYKLVRSVAETNDNGRFVLYTDHIAALSQRPADPAWISASQAPEEVNDYLTWITTKIVSPVRRGEMGYWSVESYYGEGWHNHSGTVTHWQPLPAPPLASPVPKEKENG